ncbi:hypothetical protein CDAR_478341 [Caerostris darwini]|uniref:Uncharacterized protein n=1 Tax=Caerostris darwini TaxID=1538125 RepID=A0AAV4QHK7_9ARAC|nr:hypothetical protein CDAR_478341 [Caerostris darwini]
MRQQSKTLLRKHRTKQSTEKTLSHLVKKRLSSPNDAQIIHPLHSSLTSEIISTLFSELTKDAWGRFAISKYASLISHFQTSPEFVPPIPGDERRFETL